MKLTRLDKITLAPKVIMDPSQACTRRLGILGGTGSGKTYLGTLLAEQLYLSGAPFLVIDPVGNWGYSLRLAADGKSPGLPIPVIGGDYGDIGFDSSGGALVGEFLRRRDASAVIDVSELSNRQMNVFIPDLFDALYKVSRKRRTPYMVILEEAQTFVPQNIGHGEERMFGSVRRWGRLSRNYGGGITLVTQRPQSVSKEVFNQVECMFVGNLRGPHERKSVKDWVDEHGLEQVKAMIAKLPKLAPGDFFCWSPVWLELFEQIHVNEKLTFDGTSTPVLGKAAESKTLAPIDLGELGVMMAAAKTPLLEEGKGKTAKLVDSQALEQVRVLGAELERLQKERTEQAGLIAGVARKIGEASEAMEHGARLLVDALGSPLFEGFPRNGILAMLEEDDDPRIEAVANLAQAVDDRLTDIIEGRPSSHTRGGSAPAVPQQPVPQQPIPKQPIAGRAKSLTAADFGDSGATGDYVNAILSVIAQHGPLNRHKLSILSGKSRSSSTFASAIRMLVGGGQVVDDRAAGHLVATALGKKQAKPSPLPTGRALYDYWKSRLGEYDRKVFETIATGPRDGLTRQDISKRTGCSYSSSTFAESFRTLRALGLAVERSKRWRLDETVRAACGL